MKAVEQRYQDAFTGYCYQDGESKAKEEDIPVTFLFWKIILEIVTDKAAREGDKRIGYHAIGEGNTQAEPKPHEKDGLQEGPNEPPADEDEEELSNG